MAHIATDKGNIELDESGLAALDALRYVPIEKQKIEKIQQLENDHNSYITSIRGYTIAKQTTLIACYNKVLLLIASEGSTEVLQGLINRLLALYAWIGNINTYRYSKESEINDSENPKEVIWNYSQFDESDPEVNIREFNGI